MAVTDIANSNLTFTGVPVGVQVTKVTDSSADWASVSNDTYFYDKTDKLIHYKNTSGIVLELFSASGLTYFTEAQATAAPNATVPVDSLTAVSVAANADIAIIPKGTGSISLSVSDNAATGGNKRGAGAIDLQTYRTNANQVASGINSIILGQGCRSYGTYSTAVGSFAIAGSANSLALGFGATATASESVAILGGTTSGSAQYSLAIGNTAAASNTNAVAIGQNTTASGLNSLAVNRYTTSDAYCSNAFGNATHTFGVTARSVFGHFNAALGDCQKSIISLTARTATATATTLTVGGSAASTTNQVILRNQSAYRFKGTIIGKESGSSNVAAWDIDGLIVRTTSAATTSLVVGNVNLVSNIPGWGTPTLAADTTNGGLRVQVTGAVTDIQWTSIIETSEVIFDAI